MPKIKVLDQATVNQIAAGEVVERPSSVVKELTENAIDSGATAITVEIKEGGISFLRVTDNGCGIETEDIPSAFLPHATSKIQSGSDLLKIQSLGFRGEALASIAAVSKVEFITKTRAALSGNRYQIEGGMPLLMESIGCPDGTTILVRDLFYNTPARRKFLKTVQTEAAYCSDLLERLALSNQNIAFKFIHNNKTLLQTNGNRNLKEIIYGIYGKEIAAALLELNGVSGDFAMEGYVGKPIISRGNRNYETYFVNGRYVKHPILTAAIEDSYKTHVMQHKFPFTVFHLMVPSDLVDVNVHPTKMEVRFRDQDEIYTFVSETIQETLQQSTMIRNFQVSKPEKPKEQEKKLSSPVIRPAEPFEERRKEKETIFPIMKEKQEIPPTRQEEIKTTSFIYEKPVQGEQLFLFEEKEEEKKLKNPTIIGSLFSTYWLIEEGDQFFMIDQHAAHERILYEKIKRQYEKKEIFSQNIAPPLILTLPLREETIFLEQRELLEKLGFQLEHFGGKEYAISSLPANLYGQNGASFFLTFLDLLASDSKKATIEVLFSHIVTAACKAAIKGNQTLSKPEAKQLIEELLKLDQPFHCPHGRPIVISMSKKEIEKEFKRI